VRDEEMGRMSERVGFIKTLLLREGNCEGEWEKGRKKALVEISKVFYYFFKSLQKWN